MFTQPADDVHQRHEQSDFDDCCQQQRLPDHSPLCLIPSPSSSLLLPLKPPSLVAVYSLFQVPLISCFQFQVRKSKISDIHIAIVAINTTLTVPR